MKKELEAELLKALRSILHEATTDVAGLPREEALDVISAIADIARETLKQVNAAPAKHVKVIFGTVEFYDYKAVVHEISREVEVPEDQVDDFIETHASRDDWIIPDLYEYEIEWLTEQKATNP